MVPSKARGFVRELVCRGSLPPLPAGLAAEAVLAAAREQGMASLLLGALERERPAWADAILAPARRGAPRAARAHARADRPRGARPRAARGARDPGAAAQGSRARRDGVRRRGGPPDVGRRPARARALFRTASARSREAGFTEVARGDHAWAFRDPAGHGILELHRSVVSAPGLYPLDREGLWARRRAGRGQLRVLPSAEDLLLQLAFHAAFQHGLVLSLAQWLDFRLVLEREPIDVARLAGARHAPRAPSAARRGARRGARP